MKTVYLIGGPMGVGKTTVCQILKNQQNNCVFLDGDWCWDMHPFIVNEQTKAMVMKNICFMLNQFVCQILKNQQNNCVFLDGDWCWDMHPFIVNEQTKAMVMKNICFMLNQFIHCPVYETILFCWVMHEQGIIDEILSNLDVEGCRIRKISLVCQEKELKKRLKNETILFCWVMHEQGIIDEILSNLDVEGCRIRKISLVCQEKELKKRLKKDIDAGIRTVDVIERSLERLKSYGKLDTEKIDVSDLTAQQVADTIWGTR